MHLPCTTKIPVHTNRATDYLRLDLWKRQSLGKWGLYSFIAKLAALISFSETWEQFRIRSKKYIRQTPIVRPALLSILLWRDSRRSCCCYSLYWL